MEVDPSPISVHTILATAMGCMMYGSPERRFTPLCACLAKLNAFVMISTFCGAWSLDNCPKVPETLGLSFPHPPVPESAFHPSYLCLL